MMEFLRKDLEMEKVFFKPRQVSNTVVGGKTIEDMEMGSRDTQMTVSMLVSLLTD